MSDTAKEQEKKQQFVVPGGCGPTFEVDDFPEPLGDITPKKPLAILGPRREVAL